MADQLNEENQSSDLALVLEKLTPDQIRFVVARLDYDTDKEAAESLGIPANRVYQWKSRKIPIDDAVRLMTLDGLITALHVRKRNLAKAMLIKVSGLESDDERLRQSVATEIIEWETGKATQRQEHSGPDGGDIGVKLSRTFDEALDRIFGEDGDGG